MELKPEATDYRLEDFKLLIVPYGIETQAVLPHPLDALPFNRTIWN